MLPPDTPTNFLVAIGPITSRASRRMSTVVRHHRANFADITFYYHLPAHLLFVRYLPRTSNPQDFIAQAPHYDIAQENIDRKM